jgi:hypothetical protein
VQDVHAGVMQALRGAQLGTVALVKALEGAMRGQLKDIGKLRRNITETKKHELEMIEVTGPSCWDAAVGMASKGRGVLYACRCLVRQLVRQLSSAICAIPCRGSGSRL